MKKCNTCSQEKPFESFHKNPRHKFGVDNTCRKCRSKQQAENFKKNWFKQTAILKKSWCKKNNVPFDLDGDYLESIWTDCCPVFGVKFVRHKKSHDYSPALDRFDPAKGYVKGNVVYISARANRIKYDASVEELKKVLAFVEGATTIP